VSRLISYRLGEIRLIDSLDYIGKKARLIVRKKSTDITIVGGHSDKYLVASIAKETTQQFEQENPYRVQIVIGHSQTPQMLTMELVSSYDKPFKHVYLQFLHQGCTASSSADEVTLLQTKSVAIPLMHSNYKHSILLTKLRSNSATLVCQQKLGSIGGNFSIHLYDNMQKQMIYLPGEIRSVETELTQTKKIKYYHTFEFSELSNRAELFLSRMTLPFIGTEMSTRSRNISSIM